MTKNLLDWDEDLQTDSAEEYQALLNGLRRSQGFGLFFVQCSPFSGGKLIERLQSDITDKKIAIIKLDKPIIDGNVFKRIQTFLTEYSPVEILIIQGLENSLFDAEETKKRLGWSDEKANAYTWREVPPVLINLNQQRERFRDSFPICFIFLLPQYAIKYLVHRAPDFFDWRSGLVNYASDTETLAQESERILKESDYNAYQTWSEEELTARLFAIQALTDELEITSRSKAQLYLEQGLIFAAARDSSAAALCFEKASSIKPNYHEAIYNKGVALGELGQYEAAIVAYDQALALQPHLCDAFYNKGIALRNLDQYEAAIVAYDQALALKPNYHEALNNKGVVLGKLGQYEAAVVNFNAALAIKPDYSEALNNKGVTLSRMGKKELAIDSFEQALSIKFNDHEVLYNRGVVLLGLGQYEAAIASFGQALAIKSDDYDAIYNKACCYSLQGDIENAIDCLKKAINVNPHNRDDAKTDTDFDPIRHDERFRALVERNS